MTLAKGQKVVLEHLNFSLVLTATNPKHRVLDAALFGVDQDNKLSDDAFMCFFNQKESPRGALRMLDGQQGELQRFEVKLDMLPQSVCKLVLTLSIDGEGSMRDLTDCQVSLVSAGQKIMEFKVSGTDFDSEKAIIVLEVYLKNTWRLSAVGQGFSGGLSSLLAFYGGTEITPPPKAPSAKAINLQKRLEASAAGQKLINLAKVVNITLEKQGIDHEKAAVVLALDASGSMRASYKNGAVQKVVDRVATLAIHLDDDGCLETWFYSRTAIQTPDVTLGNIENYINNTAFKQGRFMQGLGGTNNEPAILQALLDKHRNSNLPVLVIFISDGGVSQTREIQRIITEAAHAPIFWQLIGLAGHNYGIFERLDDLSGRVVDNANFFAIDDLADISDEQLYQRMLTEFPTWLKAVRDKRILR